MYFFILYLIFLKLSDGLNGNPTAINSPSELNLKTKTESVFSSKSSSDKSTETSKSENIENEKRKSQRMDVNTFSVKLQEKNNEMVLIEILGSDLNNIANKKNRPKEIR